jgi:hypothetical protein
VFLYLDKMAVSDSFAVMLVRLQQTILADGKTIGGRNRLTDERILAIQKYYGLAIRRNTGNLNKMRQAVWAQYFHLNPLIKSLIMGFVRKERIAGVNISEPSQKKKAMIIPSTCIYLKL